MVFEGGTVMQMFSNPTAPQLALLSGDGDLALSDFGGTVARVKNTGEATSASWRADGKVLYLSTDNGKIVECDVVGGKVLKKHPDPSKQENPGLGIISSAFPCVPQDVMPCIHFLSC